MVLVPISQNLTNTRTASQFGDILKVLLNELEGFRRHVRDIYSDKLAGVNRRLHDLLHKERSEGLDSTTQEFGVEWDVDAPEGNCGKAALEFDWLRLSFGLLSTLLDNLDELLLGALKRHLRHEGLNVNFLHLEEVEHVGEAVEGA